MRSLEEIIHMNEQVRGKMKESDKMRRLAQEARGNIVLSHIRGAADKGETAISFLPHMIDEETKRYLKYEGFTLTHVYSDTHRVRVDWS